MISKLAILLVGFLFLSCFKQETIKVGIQPFDNFDRALTDTVAAALTKTFGVHTVILPTKPIPEISFTNIKSPRYRADKIIQILKSEKPDSLDHIISLTDKDISTTKKDKFGNTKKPLTKYEDWGILGLGYRPGPSCIISTYRIKGTSRIQFVTRLKKISIHEFGHNLGLDHCVSEQCVMKDAMETIKTIDYVSAGLCELCVSKIEITQQ